MDIQSGNPPKGKKAGTYANNVSNAKEDNKKKDDPLYFILEVRKIPQLSMQWLNKS